MTGNLIDIQNADVILITSNFGENHPVGFRWARKAQERGAKIIHVDPRFTRTSALADIYAPIRSGTNVLFFGALMNYAIQNELYQKDYLLEYTNATFLIDPGFKFEDGYYSGWNPVKKNYDQSTWKYQTEIDGKPKQDKTLQDPNCVFQILKRHYSRYTPEMVERVCGMAKEKFLEVAMTYCATGAKDKSGCIVYALNLTQHTNGVQNISSLCMFQLLLGNIGVPGGGVAALRGHSNVQGATDLAVLFHDLPGYLGIPRTKEHPTLRDNIEKGPKSGYWVNRPNFLISLLKAWYGAAANKENDFAYDHLPKISKAYSHMHIFEDMHEGKIKGFLVIGQNPAVGGPNAGLERKAMEKLDWLVVKDIFETETAAFWKAPGVDPKGIRTEVFFLPSATGVEKDGSLTNTMRLVQWHHKAVASPGDCRSDAWFVYDLGRRLKKLYATSTQKKDRPLLDMTWDYGEKEPDMVRVLKEMNGYTVADGKPVPGFAALKADGSTACGIWIYSGIYPEEGKNRAASRSKAGLGLGLAHGWGYSWPANRRILYNRASADPSGKPWSEKKKLIWWDEGQKKWAGYDVPDFKGDLPPDAKKFEGGPFKGLGGMDPFIMLAEGKGRIFAPLAEGPLPEHYEPIESPIKNPVSKVQNNPMAKVYKSDLNKVGAPEQYPIIVTTYRLTEHHLSGTMSRHLPWLAETFASHFFELSPELAKEKGISDGDVCTIMSARGKIRIRAMITKRVRPYTLDGKKFHLIGIPWHWGFMGIAKGEITNDLTAHFGDPNVFTQESKAFLCDVKKGVV